MTKAIVTLIDGPKYEELARTSLPLMKAYAQKVNAELIILDNKIGLPVPHYAKLQIRNLKFDSVLFLDTDILVNPNAPDIFEAYPKDKLALLDEGKFEPRDLEFAFFTGCFNSQRYFLNDWDRRYFNTGVMLIPGKFLKEFTLSDRIINHYGEQSYLNLLFSVKKLPIVDLDKTWNYQIGIFGKADRLKQNFIHFTTLKEDQFLFNLDAEALTKKKNT
jgi:lipopolysaccharide biosynthesis glycosyltransferase